MEKNNDSFFDKMLLKNIDKEISIDFNLIDILQKIHPLQQVCWQSQNWKNILIKIKTKQQEVDIKKRLKKLTNDFPKQKKGYPKPKNTKPFFYERI